MAKYTVTLKTPEGEKKLSVADDQYILDAAEARAVHIIPTCRIDPDRVLRAPSPPGASDR